MRPAATYSPNAELGVSTMGPEELNFRVRNGNGCFLSGITTSLIPVRSKRADSKTRTLFSAALPPLAASGGSPEAQMSAKD